MRYTPKDLCKHLVVLFESCKMSLQKVQVVQCKTNFTKITHILAPITAPPLTNVSRPCTPSPCGRNECGEYDGHVAICNPCIGEDALYNPACQPECLTDADCSFNKACLNHACIDPCPGSCGLNAFCTVILHTPSCSCPPDFIGNPFESCTPRCE